jgi:hypothetical protein
MVGTTQILLSTNAEVKPHMFQQPLLILHHSHLNPRGLMLIPPIHTWHLHSLESPLCLPIFTPAWWAGWILPNILSFIVCIRNRDLGTCPSSPSRRLEARTRRAGPLTVHSSPYHFSPCVEVTCVCCCHTVLSKYVRKRRKEGRV